MKRDILIIAFVGMSWTSGFSQVGKVGINTINPAAMLHVQDSSVLFAGPITLPPFPALPPVSGSGIRTMWYADKGAFRTGRVTGAQWDRDSIGVFSFASGLNTKAKGAQSIALGNGANATASGTVAMGTNANASGGGAVSIGTNTTASGSSSLALGTGTQASGSSTTATGSNTIASGNNATAMGVSSQATGNNSVAMGASTMATGVSSISMGNGTKAIGTASTAMGFNSRAKGNNSTATGLETQSNGFSSMVIGQYNDTLVAPQNAITSSTPLLIVGNGDPGSPSNALVIRKDGRVGVGINDPMSALDINGQIRVSGGSPATGKVLTSDANGLATWETPMGGADNLGNHMATQNLQTKGFFVSNDGGNEGLFVDTAGQVGIGLNMPASRLHVKDKSVLFDAPDPLPSVPSATPWSGTPHRLFWYADKAALRAGYFDQTYSHPDSIGKYSLALGYNHAAKGIYSAAFGAGHRTAGLYATAFGEYNEALGHSSLASGSNVKALKQRDVAFGEATVADGPSALATGSYSQALGNESASFGLNTKATGNQAVAMGNATQATSVASFSSGFGSKAQSFYSMSTGFHTRANGYSSAVVGMFNDSMVAPELSVSPSTPLFIIGNGDNNNARSNAMVVRKDGWVGIGTSNPLAHVDVNLGNVLFRGLDIPPFPAGDLPDPGTGRRMLWYADKTAFRASYNLASEWHKDSIGYSSIAAGESVVASGYGSAAFGTSCFASGNYTFAAGNNCSARADFSTSIGWACSSFGLGSFTSGFGTETYGNLSLAAGFLTKAKGMSCVAVGRNTWANGYSSLVLGVYNDTLVAPEISISPTTPLLIVGNGDDEDQLSNALVVRKDGHVGIGNVNPAYGLHVASHDGGEGGIVDGIVVENFHASVGEAGISFKNSAVPASRKWSVGINQSPPNLSFNYGTNFSAANTMIAIDTLGRMGVNTTSPQALFHLMHVNPSGGIYHANAHSIFESSNISYMQLSSETADETGILSGNQVTSIRSAVVFSADSSLHLRSGGNTTRLALTKTGNVGIGTVTPTFQFQVSTNSAAKPTSNTWAIASDGRLKKNVHDYTDGLDAILHIRPVWFTYTGEAGLPEDTGVGVIAQDLKEIAPYMVGTWSHQTGDGPSKEYLSVDNGAMTYMLINAVKEQQAQIENQQALIQELLLRLEALEKQSSLTTAIPESK